MNLLTVIVILIFAIAALRGYRRGFIKSLASMASIVLSVVLVNLAMPYVTDFLKTQTPVYEYIVERMEETFSAHNTERAQNGQSAAGGSALMDPQTQRELIDRLPIPDALKNLLVENNTPQFYAQLAANTFAEYVPRYLASLILAIVSFVVTWVLVIVVLFLAVKALDLMSEMPVIHGLNCFLGLALGLVQGLIVVWIAFLVITLFLDTQVGGQLMAMIAESPFLDVLYKENILLDFLTSLLGSLG